MRPNRLTDHGSNGEIGDVMVIHHVKMNKVSASSLNVPNLFAKSGKICGKDARGNPISRGGSHGFDSRSALAAHGPPDDKKQ